MPVNKAVMAALKQRNSSAKLSAPAPSDEALEQIFQAACRAPDHAALRPWRFITISGESLEKLGELFVKAKGQPLSEEKQAKLSQKPQRAPLIIVPVVHLQEHPKVPEIEQWLALGASVQNILLAIEAQGFAAMWRTGEMAFNETVRQGLGLADNEQMAGFIYVGTRAGKTKPVPSHNTADYVRPW